MNVMYRKVAAFGLALVVVLASLQMGVARGQAAPAGTIVICTGTGPISLLVDQEGRPTGAVHLCPDCAMTLFVAVAAGAQPDAASAFERLAVARPEARRGSGRAALPPQARGPPIRL